MFTIIVPEVSTRSEIRSALIEYSQVWDGKTWYVCADGHMTTDLNNAIERDVRRLDGTRKLWQDFARSPLMGV